MPTEDLDALVSITSDENLANVMEEYERVDSPPPSWLKIRAFLSPPKSLRRVSNDSSSLLSRSYSFSSAWSSSSSSSRRSAGSSKFGSWPRNSMVPPSVNRLVHQVSPPTADPIGIEKICGEEYSCPSRWAQGNHGHVYPSPRKFTVRMRQMLLRKLSKNLNACSKSNLGYKK